MKKSTTFKYTFSAPTQLERKEVEQIRNEYLNETPQSNKLATLKKYHSIVKNVPQTITLIVGIVFLLIFGLGMTFAIEWNNILVGSIIAGVSIVPMIINPFLHKKLTRFYKNKYRDQIIKLSDEILNDGNE